MDMSQMFCKTMGRYKPQDFNSLLLQRKVFTFNDARPYTCAAGKPLTSSGVIYTTVRGLRYQTHAAKATDCGPCPLSGQCFKGKNNGKAKYLMKTSAARGRQVTRFEPTTKDSAHPSECTRQAIDSPRERQLYSQPLRSWPRRGWGIKACEGAK